MTLKELFKMIDNANKFNDLICVDRNYLSIRTWDFGKFDRFESIKAFKKFAKSDYTKETIDEMLNMPLKQAERCKYQFDGEEGFCVVIH